MGYLYVGSAQGCSTMGIPMVEHPCILPQWGQMHILHQALVLPLTRSYTGSLTFNVRALVLIWENHHFIQFSKTVILELENYHTW